MLTSDHLNFTASGALLVQIWRRFLRYHVVFNAVTSRHLDTGYSPFHSSCDSHLYPHYFAAVPLLWPVPLAHHLVLPCNIIRMTHLLHSALPHNTEASSNQLLVACLDVPSHSRRTSWSGILPHSPGAAGSANWASHQTACCTLKHQQRLSSRDPQGSTKRVRSTRSIRSWHPSRRTQLNCEVFRMVPVCLVRASLPQVLQCGLLCLGFIKHQSRSLSSSRLQRGVHSSNVPRALLALRIASVCAFSPSTKTVSISWNVWAISSFVCSTTSARLTPTHGNPYTASGASYPMNWSLWEACISKSFSHRFSSATQKWKRISMHFFPVYCHRGGNCMRLLLCACHVLPSDSNLPASFQRWQISFRFCFLPVLLSRYAPFVPQNCEPSFSDPEIALQWFSSSGGLVAYPSTRCRCQCGVELLRLAYPHRKFCTLARLRSKTRLHPISYQSLGHRLHIKLHPSDSEKSRMDSWVPVTQKVCVDHVRDLSAT